LNKHFDTVAEKLTNKKSQTAKLINDMPNNNSLDFSARPTTYKK